MKSLSKTLLRSSVSCIVGAGALAVPQQAMAACTVAANAVTCATTTTTDTTNAGTTPAVDRNYPVDTSAAGFTGTVSSGAIVDGYGLAFTNTVGGANTLTVVNNGTVQINPGNTATAGGSAALGVTAIGATSIDYSGTGDVLNLGPTGNGLELVSTGTGNITANVGGNVTGSGVGSDGVRATSTSGTVTVNVNGGNITGTDDAIQIGTSGLATVNVAAGRTLTGAYGVYSAGTGALVVNNNGTITGTTDSILTALNTTGTTINNNAGGRINGALDLSNGVDIVNNSGTLSNLAGSFFYGGNDALNTRSGGITNLGGTIDFGAGTDVLGNAAGGTVNAAAGTVLLGLETVNNSGTLNAAAGMTLDAGDTIFTNSGTFNVGGTVDFGAGTDALVNNPTGTINLSGNTVLANLETFTQNGKLNLNTFTLTGPAMAFTNGTTGVIDTNGNASLLGFTSFTNNGTLDLGAGTFTVPAAVFTNTGTILADEGASTITGQTSFANSGTLDLQDGATGDVLTINSSFVGNAGSTLLIDASHNATDELVINGAASGTTTVGVNLLDLGFTDPTGLLVVDTTSSSANAFVLGSINDSPLASYQLVQRGADYFLVSSATAATFQPLSLAIGAIDIWHQSADEVVAHTRLPNASVTPSFWAQAYVSRDKDKRHDVQTIGGTDYDVDTSTTYHRSGVQAGLDFGFGMGHAGLTGGIERARTNSLANLRMRGFNLGLYGQFGGPVGFHGEALVKNDWFKVDVRNGVFADNDTKGHALGADGAIGYRFPVGTAATVDVNAGINHVRTKLNKDIDLFGFTYDFGTFKSTRARGGVRAIFAGGWQPYVDATLYHEFDGDARVTLFDGVTNYDFDSRGKGTWGRIEAGVGGPSAGTGAILAAWADIGDRKGLGLRAGFRFGGGSAEPAPVAAPLPAVQPAPAPATQTCADGTVILATSTCPVAPPPPPPPPVERGERG